MQVQPHSATRCHPTQEENALLFNSLSAVFAFRGCNSRLLRCKSHTYFTPSQWSDSFSLIVSAVFQDGRAQKTSTKYLKDNWSEALLLLLCAITQNTLSD